MSPHLVVHGGTRDDPVLLCLHGIGSCGDAFAHQAALAARCGRHVVAWDAPGYRHSPDPSSPFGLDDWADAAADVIKQLGGTADVLGVSWGGVTATRLTLRHPQLVRSLILADSSVGSATDPERAEAMRSRFEGLASLGLEAFCSSRAPRLVSDAAPQALVDAAEAMMAESVRLPIYEWACASLADTDHTNDLDRITAPTLVVVGEQDVVTPLARAQVLADGIARAELATIPRAGHLANQEQPDAFNEVVANFLDCVNIEL